MPFDIGDYVLNTFLGEYEVGRIKEIAYSGDEIISVCIDLERGPRWMSPDNIIQVVKQGGSDE